MMHVQCALGTKADMLLFIVLPSMHRKRLKGFVEFAKMLLVAHLRAILRPATQCQACVCEGCNMQISEAA